MPIHVPMVDVHTIGAGGGSLASVDAGGHAAGRPGERGRDAGADLLRPRRHAADDHRCEPRARPARPGAPARRSTSRSRSTSLRAAIVARGRRAARPRCDRRGGRDRARRQRQDGRRGAHGEPARGHDPRDFALFAFGGAGPLHAVALARELGIPTVLIPARPGLTNALGCVVADLRHDFVATVNQPLEALAEARIGAVFAAQIAAGRERIAREQVAVERIVTRAPRRHAVPGPEPHPAGRGGRHRHHARPSCAPRSRPRTGSASASSCRRSGRCSSTCTPR